MKETCGFCPQDKSVCAQKYAHNFRLGGSTLMKPGMLLTAPWDSSLCENKNHCFSLQSPSSKRWYSWFGHPYSLGKLHWWAWRDTDLPRMAILWVRHGSLVKSTVVTMKRTQGTTWWPKHIFGRQPGNSDFPQKRRVGTADRTSLSGQT